tara:strand:- start:68 stop:358 length:291 start_codon:yes stop_codon:yes gene_type:complete
MAGTGRIARNSGWLHGGVNIQIELKRLLSYAAVNVPDFTKPLSISARPYAIVFAKYAWISVSSELISKATPARNPQTVIPPIYWGTLQTMQRILIC